MSKATKNAHDWHCEEHDVYGWKGEACRQCPEAPSLMSAIVEARIQTLVDELMGISFVSYKLFAKGVEQLQARKSALAPVLPINPNFPGDGKPRFAFFGVVETGE